MLAAPRHGVLLAEALDLLRNLLPVLVVSLDVVGVVHHDLVRLAVVRWVRFRIVACRESGNEMDKLKKENYTTGSTVCKLT